MEGIVIMGGTGRRVQPVEGAERDSRVVDHVKASNVENHASATELARFN
jgi:hypothetical protein